MDDFGENLSILRKGANLTQAQLAEAIGVSQATISRLEASKTFSGEVGVAARLARFFKTPLKDLLPNLHSGVSGESFFAFCPNPLCAANEIRANVGLVWKSYQEYPSDDYSEVNFCSTCGTALCKECPSCQRKFDKKLTHFCTRCGSKVCDRPTAKEMEEIKALTDIPF